MPGTSGWDVLAAMERNGDLGAVPVIMVSAQDAQREPLTSPVLLAAMGEGFTQRKLLRAGLALAQVMLTAD